MTTVDASTRAMLQLRCTDGIGPVLGARLLGAFGSAERALAAPPTELAAIRGIGRAGAARIAAARRAAADRVEPILAAAAAAKVDVVTLGGPGYPPLLQQTPDPPLALFVRGPLAAGGHPVAIVGSRRCSTTGREQAGRFAAALAGHGLVVVSGGARGVDTAAHVGALEAAARRSSAGAEADPPPTIVVLGCGHLHAYPPENAGLFARIVEAGGAVVSELAPHVPPAAEHFPARNRIIAGLSLGVLVVEAPLGSGALITAQLALDLGREVMALPGSVDRPSAAGGNRLLREGAAAVVLEPGDVLDELEAPARHQHGGTHDARYGQRSANAEASPTPPAASAPPRTPMQQHILDALGEPRSVEAVARLAGIEVAQLQAELTMLELVGAVVRDGGRLRRGR